MRKAPCGVRSAVQRRPSSVLTMRKSVSVSVGELNALDGVLLGHLARDEPHLPAGRQPADRLVGRVARRSTAPTSGACSDAPRMNRKNASDREGHQPRRRAHAAAQVLERRPAAARAAQQHARRRPAASSGGSQTSGAVQKNIASPCQIGRTSHSRTSATSASAIGMGRRRRAPALTLVIGPAPTDARPGDPPIARPHGHPSLPEAAMLPTLQGAQRCVEMDIWLSRRRQPPKRSVCTASRMSRTTSWSASVSGVGLAWR